jgi:hypothetical protein
MFGLSGIVSTTTLIFLALLFDLRVSDRSSNRLKKYIDSPHSIIVCLDLLFHTEEVLASIGECAGADWLHDHVVYTSEAIKQGEYYGTFPLAIQPQHLSAVLPFLVEKIKPQSSLLTAIIKYGQDNGKRSDFLTDAEKDYAGLFLDHTLMKAFHYRHPI